MLGFRINPNRSTGLRRLQFGQVNDLLQGRHLKLPIESHVGWPDGGYTLYRAQCFKLRQRQVFGEPTRNGHAIY